VIPFFQEELSGALDRPLSLGKLERVGLTGVSFSDVILPPTVNNFSWARVKQLEISFNPLELIFQRTLRPTLSLIGVDAVIRQGFDQSWNLAAPDGLAEEGFIRTELKSLQIQRARLAVGPPVRRLGRPLPLGFERAELEVGSIQNLSLETRFQGPEDQRVLAFKAGGRLKNGTFRLQGEGNLATAAVNLAVRAQCLPLAELNPFLDNALLFSNKSLASAQLTLKVRPEAGQPIQLWGTARLNQGAVFLDALDQTISDINVVVRFKAQQATLDRATLRFGPIPIEARGSVEPAGYDLGVTLPAVSLSDVQTVLELELPVKTEGKFRVNTQLSGPLDQPLVKGSIQNLGNIVVDRLGIKTVATEFSLTPGRLILEKLQVDPDTGGVVTATDQADLRDLAQPVLDFRMQTELPLDAIATLSGPLGNPQAAGHIVVDQPRVNQTPLQEVSSEFAYQDARLNFSGQVRGESPEPLTVSGSLPYAFPLMTIAPASDEIALSLRLKDDAEYRLQF
jgi:translocation and assembly module TamB